MNVLRVPETFVATTDMEYIGDGTSEQHGSLVPAHLTTFGEKVNKVLHLFGMQELEAK